MGKIKNSVQKELTNIDIKLLRIFKVIADKKGITAAEEALNLSNSAICNYLSTLETRLGVSLCKRGRKGFALTEEGRFVYQATIKLLDATESFQYLMNQLDQEILGNLHISCADFCLSYQGFQLSEIIRHFHQSAPKVHINIRLDRIEDIPSLLRSRQVDIGITVKHSDMSEFSEKLICEERMNLYCNKDHPLANQDHIDQSDLSQHLFVDSFGLSAGLCPWLKTKNIQIGAQSNYQESRAHLIMSGCYIGFLPEPLVNKNEFKDQFIAILPDKIFYINQLVAYYLKDKSSATHHFIKHI